MKQNIDEVILNKYYRKSLNMPISGNISRLRLPTRSLALNISAAKQAYSNCKLTVLRILKTSVNPDDCKLFNFTINRNPKTDDILTLADINLNANKF